MTFLRTIPIFLWMMCACQAHQPDPLRETSTTLVIPASDFLEALPKGDIITDAAGAGTDWLFNNTGIVLRSNSNLMTEVDIPEDGTYHLFVRSFGGPRSSFKIAVNDKVSAQVFGNDSTGWKGGDTFSLQQGAAKVKITRINPGSVVDVIVLSKDASLGEDDITPHQLARDVVELKAYDIPPAGAVKFGDVNGDGSTDFLVLARDFSAYVFDNDGIERWSWQAPEEYTRERSEFEPPGVLWDFDRDGKAEVVHWRMDEEGEWLVVANGETGQVVSKTPWPTKPLPHVYNNFRLAIGKLTGGPPNEIVVFTDMGGTIAINTYRSTLEPIWSHKEERRKDHLGHYIYPVDLNADDIDEVLVGPILFDAKGKMIWNRFDLLSDHHDHADNYKFADINGDGALDIVTANSETGVFIFEAMTGEVLWQQVAEHSQQIEAGDFLPHVPGVEVVVGGRTYGNRQVREPYLSAQLFWFNSAGKFLFRWPQTPLNGNPDFVKGDWSGNGQDQLFWFKFRIDEKGRGKLYFPDPVYHMFDFTGSGAEEVITLSRGKLRVFGSAAAGKGGIDRKRDLRYLQTKVVNHTHY